jgi:hypothetical protein
MRRATARSIAEFRSWRSEIPKDALLAINTSLLWSENGQLIQTIRAADSH